MKITKPEIMYVACVYMLDTKADKKKDMAMLRYKNSEAYGGCKAEFCAEIAAREIIKEAYNSIIIGEITFPGINNFDKSKVELHGTTDVIYRYDDSSYEVLCCSSIDKLNLFREFGRETSWYDDGDPYPMPRHVFCRYGLFWYLIANIDEYPVIVKKFWWFTSINKLIDDLFNEFESGAI